MFNKTILIILIVLSITALSTFAEINSNAGKAGLSFLKIGAGAKAASMGDAYTALSNDATGTYWNPAGLSFIQGVDITLMHNEWFQDVRYEFISGATNDGKNAFGANVMFLTVGDIERREMTGEPMGTFSSYDWAFSISYANRITENFSVGLTTKLLYEKIHIYEAIGFGVDFGLIYKPYLIAPFDGLQFGAALQNLGTKMRFVKEDFDLPLTYKIGLAYTAPINLLQDTYITITTDAILPTDNDFRIQTGLELDFMKTFFLRGGYKFNHDTSDMGFGTGFMMGIYKVDYAYVPYSNNLGDTHRISLGVGF